MRGKKRFLKKTSTVLQYPNIPSKQKIEQIVFPAGQFVLGLLGIIWILGVNEKNSSKEIRKVTWDLINAMKKLMLVEINPGC